MRERTPVGSLCSPSTSSYCRTSSDQTDLPTATASLPAEPSSPSLPPPCRGALIAGACIHHRHRVGEGGPCMGRSEWLTHPIRFTRRWAWLGFVPLVLGLTPIAAHAQESAWLAGR